MTGKGCIIPDFRLLGNIWPICLLLVPTHSSPLIPPTWGVNFNNMFMCSFYKQRFQKRKKDSQVISVFLRFWYLHMQKLLKTCCWNWHKWSISPTCLCAAFTNKDSKSAKRTVKSSVSFCAFGICTCKSCSKHVVEIDTSGQFFQHVYVQLLQMKIPKAQKIFKSSVSFCTFEICTCKSCS